ncbi:hypothetical protein Hanom_Chr09g00840311 [Helianthus anomalus]
MRDCFISISRGALVAMEQENKVQLSQNTRSLKKFVCTDLWKQAVVLRAGYCFI